MGKEIQGQLEGKGRKFAIVVSRFNELFSGKLLDGAKDCLERHGVNSGGVDIYWVPGSFEIAPVAKRVAAMKYDAVICLGAVIRGDTPHFNYIAAEVSKGIAQVSLQSEIPVVFGVITCDTLEQAIERSGAKAGNKGYSAAEAALEMADVFAKIAK